MTIPAEAAAFCQQLYTKGFPLLSMYPLIGFLYAG